MAPKHKAQSDVVSGRFKSRILVAGPNSPAKGTETRTSQRPQWSAAEIGLAAAAGGVPEAPFRAALYAFAGAREDNLWFLHGELMGHIRMFSRLYHWPERLVDFYGLSSEYKPRLAKLVLDEDAHSNYFRTAPELFALYLNIPQKLWEDRVQGFYSEVKGVWSDWLSEAARRIQSRLSESEHGE